ncbi:MAG: hypothetical protein EXR52_03500 [Dehalococcoidia bacterium]|nr:hypothetical protein [Dehalococcoidia bacterium]
MISLVAEKLDQVADLCRRHHVRRLDLFGSAATGRFDPATSDLDFLVEFEPMAPVPYAIAFDRLKEALGILLDVDVDLVSAKMIRNPYFAASVEAGRVGIYDAA